jgi:hypothetical protein
MKERLILFSGPMVRALLAGTKTQTRRIVKPQPGIPLTSDDVTIGKSSAQEAWAQILQLCPYGQPGDQLWVRETWRTWNSLDHLSPKGIAPGAAVRFEADRWNPGFGLQAVGRIRQSIFMPRWASRITLEIVSIRVERLHDISREDAIAEGLKPCRDDHWVFPDSPQDQSGLCHTDPEIAYSIGWEMINGPTGPASWDANPWVWVVEFKRIGGAS